ncbi:MAG: sodium/proline symporter [Gemmatimonadota bacterium]|nr:sodium/proline symporter [Gemmatimonadota bacterium]
MTQELAQGPTLAAGGQTLIAFVGYLAVIVGIGAYATRFSSAGVREFFVGGRTMNRFVVALSAVVSGRSAWLLLGVTGMAYAQGPSAVWAVVGYISAEMLLFIFFAPRLRRFAERYDSVTLPDFFASRLGDPSGVLRTVLAVVILIFMVSYVSSQFVGGGKAFAASFDITPTAGILITAAIVLLYTTMGGFLAVSLTDMIQGVVMIFALVILPIIAISNRGGLIQVYQELSAFDATMVDPFAIAMGAAIGLVGIGLGSPGNPHILVRYMSIKDAEQLKYAAVVGTIWNVVMAWGAVFIGLVGRLYFPSVEMLPNGDTENLYPALAQLHLHPIFFGIVIASIFAAIMSTADSQLLVAASSVVRDVYEKVLAKDKEVSQRVLVTASRIVVALLVLSALLLGFAAEDLVFWLVLFAWAGLGAAIGPAALLAIYWERCTRQGVLAGLIAGTITTFVWYLNEALKSRLYELIPAFLVGLVATIIVSLLTEPPGNARQMTETMEGKN